ncbi:MAG: type IV secretion system protein VirB10 [Rubrivivax sp.]|nr:type IV secretion system protein VirB10 [Rubrivivax sp.]
MKWPKGRGSNNDGADNVIDASEILEAREKERIEGERGPPDLGGRRSTPAGAKTMLMAGVAIVLVVGGVVTAKGLSGDKAPDAKKAEQAMVVKNPKGSFKPAALSAEERQAGLDAAGAGTGGLEGEGELIQVPGADPNAPAFPTASAQGPSGGGVPALTATSGGTVAPVASGPPQPKPLSPAEIVHLRRLGSGLRSDNVMQATRDGGPPQPQAARVQAGEDGELSKALRPITLTGEKASKLGNRDYMLTQGAMLDCVLETRLESTVAGMTSCHLTRDVYSANGRVVLLDKGSKVVGFYQGGMRQGQRRIFVQWSRVETPKGVVINIASPGTGALGTGGMDGVVDTHFGERFGGSILLSLIGDFGDYFANKGRSSDAIQFQNSQGAAQDAARVALENSINIPPTLYKNQGERISIFVARDLDFSGVYKLASR